MSFIAPDHGDRGEPDVKIGRTGGSAIGEERLLRNGAQVLARGALVCPECDLPVLPAPRLHPGAWLRCGFCDRAAVAIEFLREDAIDMPENDVALVARIR